MRLPVVHHPAYAARMPPGHRFPMAKYERSLAHLLEEDVVTPSQLHRPELAPVAWLYQAHTPVYVDAALGLTLDPVAQRRIGLPLTAEVVRRSRAASAGTVLAARLALQHGLACNTAGGSHHAFADYGAGFCVFNDVAIAAAVLLGEGCIERTLVVDLDVHQGDGTAAIFADDDRVHTFSMHCAVNFPLHKQASDLDVTLEAGVADDAYLGQLVDHLRGLLGQVRPDLVFFNAGVDPHIDDRLGRLALTDEGLWRRERLVLGTCLAAGIPVVGVIGGGYAPNLDRLVRLHSILHRVAGELFQRI